jgi:predicted HicB family RNase H-like nuclease
MKYKGYIAQIDYSEEDEEFFGFVVNISQDQISFGGATVKQLKKHMEEAIEGHIKNCKILGIEPEKPYSGRITFRTTPEEHALFVEAALRSGNRSLNEWMEEVLIHEAEKELKEARAS